MSLICMPMLIINMGSEMLFILQQRLRDQNIERGKSTKVLEDVMQAMFGDKFVTEVLKPQAMYSNEDTRAIFSKLAHSSIMRLNESSMGKLYDLMAMGFKYQVLRCSQPQMLMQVTLNHLELVRKMADNPRILELLDNVIQLSLDTYCRMDTWGWMQLRSKLLEFFQGRRIKVSIFLQNAVQRVDGSIVLKVEGHVPVGSEVPGQVGFFEEGRLVSSSSVSMANVETLKPAYASYMDPTCPLGTNLYVDDAAAVKDGASGVHTENTERAAKLLAASALIGRGTPAEKRQVVAEPKRGSSRPDSKRSAADELSLLATLMGTSTKEADNEPDYKPFKLSLFPEDDSEVAEGKDEGDCVPTITIDLSTSHTNAAKMIDDLDLADDRGRSAKDGPSGHKAEGTDDDGDDLLSLMDSAK